MPKKPERQHLSVMVSSDDLGTLQKQADRQDLPVSVIVRQAIALHANHLRSSKINREGK